MLTPVAANARISVGMARPYASMLLESREGEAVAIPLDPFKAGLNPTDAELQQFYAANRNRYMIPEQRVLRIATHRAGAGSERHRFGPGNRRLLQRKPGNLRRQGNAQSQPGRGSGPGDRQRHRRTAKGGATLAAAAAPAGANAAVTSLADQTRQAYPSVAGDKVAAAVFSAPTGPSSGRFSRILAGSWSRSKAVKTEGGKSLAQARAEIAAKLTEDKRKNAIEDIVDKVQNAVDEGSNFTEAAAAAEASGHEHAADHRQRVFARRSELQTSAPISRRSVEDRLRDRSQ